MSFICTKLTNVIKDVKFINNFFFFRWDDIWICICKQLFILLTYLCMLHIKSFCINPILYYMNEIVRYYCIIGYLSIVNINRACFTLTGSLPAPECHSYSHAPPWHSSSLHIQYVATFIILEQLLMIYKNIQVHYMHIFCRIMYILNGFDLMKGYCHSKDSSFSRFHSDIFTPIHVLS